MERQYAPTPAASKKESFKAAQQTWQQIEANMATKPNRIVPETAAYPAQPQRITPDIRFNNNSEEDKDKSEMTPYHVHSCRSRSGCDSHFKEKAQREQSHLLHPLQTPAGAGMMRSPSYRSLAKYTPKPSSLRSVSQTPTTAHSFITTETRALSSTQMSQDSKQSLSRELSNYSLYREQEAEKELQLQSQRSLAALSVSTRERSRERFSNQPSYSESSGCPGDPNECALYKANPETRARTSILKSSPAKHLANPQKHVNFVGASVSCLEEYNKRNRRHPMTPPVPVDVCCTDVRQEIDSQPSLFAVASVNNLDEEQDTHHHHHHQQHQQHHHHRGRGSRKSTAEKPFKLRYTHDRLPRYVPDDHVQAEGEPLSPHAPLVRAPNVDEQTLPMNSQLMANSEDYRPPRKPSEQRYMPPPVELVSEMEFATYVNDTPIFSLPEEQRETGGSMAARREEPTIMLTQLMNNLRMHHNAAVMPQRERAQQMAQSFPENEALLIGSGTGAVGVADAVAAAAQLENDKSWRNWMKERDPPKPPIVELSCGERRQDKSYFPRRRCCLRQLPEEPVVIAPTHAGLRQQQALQNCLPVLFYDRVDGRP